MLRLPSVAYLRDEAAAAFRRFPETLSCAIFGAAVFMWIVHWHSAEFGYEYVRLLFALALGIPLFLAGSLAAEHRFPGNIRARLAFGAAILALLGIYFGVTLDTLTRNHYVRFFQFALAAHLVVAFVAFMSDARPSRFWQFNKSLFTRFLLSTLYAYVLFLGVAIALSAVDRLFGVRIKSKVYQDLWIFCVFVFQTWHFLAAVPSDPGGEEKPADYPNGLKIFTQYLLIPLITLYGIILYAYLGKISATGKWPEGLVGWMVSAMAVGGIFNLLLIQPVKEREGNRWMRIYEKMFYAAMIPLIGMLFASVYIRVRQYGITERRYLLAVLGLWLLGVAIYFLARRNADIRRIPQSLCLLALITSFGSWGAYSVSLDSQMERLESLLVKPGLLKDGKVSKIDGVIAFEDRKEISATLDYVIKNHGLEPLEAWFAPEWITQQKKQFCDRPSFFGVTSHSASAFTKLMGFDYVTGWDRGDQWFHYYAQSDNMELPVDGFETLAVIKHGRDTETVTLMGDTCLALLDRERGVISIVCAPGAPLAVIDAGAVARSAWEQSGAAKYNSGLDPAQMTYDTETLLARARFVFDRLNGEVESDRLRVRGYSGYLLYGRK